MVTGEIKNRIDKIWDLIWVGGITNPIDTVEQLSYLLFMKMLDDSQTSQEAAANALGSELDDPIFKKGDWKNPDTQKVTPYDSLRWHNFKHFEPKKLYNIVREEVFVFVKNLSEGLDSAYARYMKDAAFLIQDPNVLVSVVDGIDSLNMNDRDTMGDVYEYVLGKMAETKISGQFRTPRHIIRMMVDMMKPTVDDVIFDPAMGTAGFIVESARYLNEHYQAQLLTNKYLKRYKNGSCEEKGRQVDGILHGYDTDPKMLRIGVMNLMLHGVTNPGVQYLNSISGDNTDSDRCTLILANPPFAGIVQAENISKSLTTVTNTKKTELLFVSLFLRMLKTGGRCASIVPDGVLFGSSKAHKDLRKELVEHQALRAVISMPSGVFQPYAGVSTAVIVFTKTNAGGTDKVWFYDMRNDGYSLDQKRNAVEGSDIPDILARFDNLKGEESRTRTDQSFLVPKEEIAANDYDLSINKYKEVVREKVVYDSPAEIMGRIDALAEEINKARVELRKMLEV